MPKKNTRIKHDLSAKNYLLLTGILLLLSACFSEDDGLKGAKELLVTQPCLPVKNNCKIHLNDESKLQLQFKSPPSYQRLLPVILESTTMLDTVSIAMIIDGKAMPSEVMKNTGNQSWEAQLLPFAAVTNKNLKIRLKLSYNAENYFAEFPVQY